MCNGDCGSWLGPDAAGARRGDKRGGPAAGPPFLFLMLPRRADRVLLARRLCVLLTGLVRGTAAHYGEKAVIEQPECMLRGDAACLFEVRFSAGTSAAA